MLNKAQLKNLSSAIYYYFKQQDNPPADEYVVPVDAIKPDREEQDVYYATVRFVIEWCKGQRKTHTIRIRFKVDDVGRFLTKTWEYV